MATLVFPVWALIISVVAYCFPDVFTGLKSMIIPLLMLVMLGMGLTLTWRDFRQVWCYRKIVSVGVAIQFTIMPIAAWLIALALGLSQAHMIGMMLVGATAGGTASNVMAYLAKGNLAISVSMTLISTLIAVFMLPFLTWLFLGQSVDVPAVSMLSTLLKIIVMPVAAGMILNHFLKRYISAFAPWFSLFSMAAILLIIAIVVALNKGNLVLSAWLVAVAVVLHNIIGLSSGYGVTRLMGYDSVIARTIAIEVGMQNSGLSVALALKYFNAASALPGALFSIWHNLSGAVFAAYWSGKKGEVKSE